MLRDAANVDAAAMEADFHTLAKKVGLAADLIDAIVSYEKQRLGFGALKQTLRSRRLEPPSHWTLVANPGVT